MHVMMIAERWGENTGIGSLRPMKITKYLLKMGCKVTIVCGSYVLNDRNPGRELEYLRSQKGYQELAFFQYSGFYQLEEKWRDKWMEYRISKKREEFHQADSDSGVYCMRKSITESVKVPLKHIFIFIDRNIYSYFKRINSARNAFCAIKNSVLEPPDLIISSYEPLQVHLLAMKLKGIYPKVRWIADFRDPLPWFGDCRMIYRLKQRLQSYICNKADEVTIVSQSWRNEMRRTGVKNVSTIYSGFDYDDLIRTVPSVGDEELTFVYTGSLYHGMYDLIPFADALNQLIDEKMIAPDKIKLIYVGNYETEFRDQMRCLDHQVKLVIKGQVSRDKALELQQKSDILLLAAYNSKKSRGHITGKMTEYWLARKPILTIMKCDVPETELKWLVEKSNTGYVYETVSGEGGMIKLKEFIKCKYDEKIENNFVENAVNDKFLEQFSYDRIAKRFLTVGGFLH